MNHPYKHWQTGDQFSQFIKDWIFKRGITQSQVSLITGKSEPTISRIINTRQGFAAECLPALINLDGGVEILKALCATAGMVPVAVPKGRPQAGTVSKEVGELLIAWSAAVEDGRLTIQEAERVRSELRDVVGAVEEYIASQAEKL